MIFTLQGIFGVRDKKKFRVKLKQSLIFWIRADLKLHRRIPATRIAARSVIRRPTPTTSLVSAPLHLSPEQMQTCTSRPLWTVSWQAGSPSCQYGTATLDKLLATTKQHFNLDKSRIGFTVCQGRSQQNATIHLLEPVSYCRNSSQELLGELLSLQAICLDRDKIITELLVQAIQLKKSVMAEANLS